MALFLHYRSLLIFLALCICFSVVSIKTNATDTDSTNFTILDDAYVDANIKSDVHSTHLFDSAGNIVEESLESDLLLLIDAAAESEQREIVIRERYASLTDAQYGELLDKFEEVVTRHISHEASETFLDALSSSEDSGIVWDFIEVMLGDQPVAADTEIMDLFYRYFHVHDDDSEYHANHGHDYEHGDHDVEYDQSSEIIDQPVEEAAEL